MSVPHRRYTINKYACEDALMTSSEIASLQMVLCWSIVGPIFEASAISMGTSES